MAKTKTKTVDGVVYEARPALRKAHYWDNPSTQYCTGCVACYDTGLCEKLQGCYRDKIIWTVKESADTTPIYEFKTVVNLEVPYAEMSEILKRLNLHWLGTEQCNEISPSGALVPKVHENSEKLTNAHFNARRRYAITLDCVVYANGAIKLKST